MPHDNQSNVYLVNGIRQFCDETGTVLDLTFSDHRNGSIQRTVEYINQVDPDICLFLYLNNLHEFVEYIECPMICGWTYDITFGGREIPDSALMKGIKHLDFLFTITPDHAKKIENGYWVPEGCDPYSHFPVTTNDNYGVSFVGQVTENSPIYRVRGFVHLDRQAWLSAIGERFPKQLSIYGNMIGNTKLSQYHSKQYLHNAWDNNVVSSNSTINLGHSGWPNVKYSWSARDYRVMAAGGFLLTNRIRGHSDFFKDGKHMAMYRSTEECLDKIAYYLQNPEERERIAQKGRERVLNHFTFKHSVETMLTHMEMI